jgi:luciferase family oxidoreductase group 1
VKLSILDQVRLTDGMTASRALRSSLELARLGDELGYERYWVAEHHGSESTVCPCPEVLLGRIGAETSEIRIGAGGVLLPHYSPLKVAESFRTLDALYPGRIDLGIGRSPGCGIQEMHALRRYRSDSPFAEDFEEQLTDLLRFLNGDFPKDHQFRNIIVSPSTQRRLPVWLLGSTCSSAAIAGKLDLSYAYAQFICPTQMQDAFERYRELRNGSAGNQSRTILAVSVICTESEDEIHKLALSVKKNRPPPNGGAQNNGVPALPRKQWEKCRFVGTPERVQHEIYAAAAIAKTEEVMILTPLADHETCMKSYRLLAEIFGLKSRSKADANPRASTEQAFKV